MIAAVSFRRQTPWLLGCSFDVMSDASEARSTLTPAAASFKTTRKGRSFSASNHCFRVATKFWSWSCQAHNQTAPAGNGLERSRPGPVRGFTIRGFTVKGVFCVNYSFDHIFRTQVKKAYNYVQKNGRKAKVMAAALRNKQDVFSLLG